jgi:hypothetical protein
MHLSSYKKCRQFADPAAGLSTTRFAVALGATDRPLPTHYRSFPFGTLGLILWAKLLPLSPHSALFHSPVTSL